MEPPQFLVYLTGSKLSNRLADVRAELFHSKCQVTPAMEVGVADHNGRFGTAFLENTKARRRLSAPRWPPARIEVQATCVDNSEAVAFECLCNIAHRL